MALKFKWNVTKEDWQKLVKDFNEPSEQLRYDGSDYYGCVYVGKLCVDIVFRCDDPNEWYIDGDFYCLTEDDRRYGYTPNNNLPYDYLESCALAYDKVHVVETNFTSFKKDVEHKLEAFIEENKNTVPLLKEAYKPLGDWS